MDCFTKLEGQIGQIPADDHARDAHRGEGVGQPFEVVEGAVNVLLDGQRRDHLKS